MEQYDDYLTQKAKSLKTYKGEKQITFRDGTQEKVNATIIGDGSFFVYGKTDKTLTHSATGMAIAHDLKSLKDAKKIVAGATDRKENWRSREITSQAIRKMGLVSQIVKGDKTQESILKDFLQEIKN